MSAHDPIPDIPGVEHIIRALQAEGDATEFLGRQAALTMFRTARHQSAPGQPAFGQPSRGQPVFDPNSTRPLPTHDQGADLRPLVRAPISQAPGYQAPGRQAPGRRRLRVVTGVSAPLAAVCVGLAAAAYAQILPGRAQNLAHSVLAPLGVPAASPAAPASPGRGSLGTTPGASAGAGGASPGPVPSASASAPADVPGVSMTLAAAKARVPAGGPDAFTGRVGRGGQPASGVRVRLLEQLPTDAGTWRVAAIGVTRDNGSVGLVVLHVPATAKFRLAGIGKLANVTSPEVTVTVAPRLFIMQHAVGFLTVTASPSAAGDTVILLRLQAGTWVTAATSRLSATHEATFAVRPTVVYRILLPATPMHAYALSARITAVAAVTSTRAGSGLTVTPPPSTTRPIELRTAAPP